MPPNNHALLGASSAHRWLNCPPSVRWEQEFPNPPSSDAAEEGTLAHAIAEEHLRQLLAGKKVSTSKKLRSHAMYKPVMEEYLDIYTGYVMELFTEARGETADAQLILEERVDYSEFVPDGFGTADVSIIADGHMHIVDLKYGKGVPVDALGNPQIRLYAIGALNAFGMLYDIHTVTMHIVQPRLDSISSETMEVADLRAWARDYVAPRAALAAEGKGEHKAGDHCRWCRCKHVCRHYAQARLDIARLQFAEPEHVERDPHQLSNEEIAEILNTVDDLTRWAKSVKEWALDQAIHYGATFPGFKVVEGRANRVIADKTAALAALQDAGFTPDAVTDLIGLGALEEVVGKKKLAIVLGDLIIKPTGKPVLARDSDKRPALSSSEGAQSVFDAFED